MILAGATVTIEVPEALMGGIALGALLLVGIVAGCLLDLLPGRAFYSRRAFEPPPVTWQDIERQRWGQLPGGPGYPELPPPRPLRGELERR